jgi:bacillithiol system protein YtxJ
MPQWFQKLINRLMTQEESPTFVEIQSLADFDQLLAHQTPIILFKHSPTCPVSLAAHRQMQAFAQARPDVPVSLLCVLNHRTLSRVIAEQISVHHESPQAILFQRGSVIGQLSHDDINVDELTSLVPAFTSVSHDAPVPASSLRSPQR